MKNAIIAFGLLALCSVAGLGQTQSDYKKFEVYGGYSNNQVDTRLDTGNSVGAFFKDRRSFNGFEASGVYNFSRYFGVKGDISGTYNKSTFELAFENSGAD